MIIQNRITFNVFGIDVDSGFGKSLDCDIDAVLGTMNCIAVLNTADVLNTLDDVENRQVDRVDVGILDVEETLGAELHPGVEVVLAGESLFGADAAGNLDLDAGDLHLGTEVDPVGQLALVAQSGETCPAVETDLGFEMHPGHEVHPGDCLDKNIEPALVAGLVPDHIPLDGLDIADEVIHNREVVPDKAGFSVEMVDLADDTDLHGVFDTVMNLVDELALELEVDCDILVPVVVDIVKDSDTDRVAQSLHQSVIYLFHYNFESYFALEQLHALGLVPRLPPQHVVAVVLLVLQAFVHVLVFLSVVQMVLVLEHTLFALGDVVGKVDDIETDVDIFYRADVLVNILLGVHILLVVGIRGVLDVHIVEKIRDVSIHLVDNKKDAADNHRTVVGDILLDVDNRMNPHIVAVHPIVAVQFHALGSIHHNYPATSVPEIHLFYPSSCFDTNHQMFEQQIPQV